MRVEGLDFKIKLKMQTWDSLTWQAKGYGTQVTVMANGPLVVNHISFLFSKSTTATYSISENSSTTSEDTTQKTNYERNNLVWIATLLGAITLICIPVVMCFLKIKGRYKMLTLFCTICFYQLRITFLVLYKKSYSKLIKNSNSLIRL